jgi:hypothetical protein
MHRYAIITLLLAGEVLAHPGHGAPAVHQHGWEWAALMAAVAAVLAAWHKAGK